MAKSRERLVARKMRRNGESIREIASVLKVSKSSVGLWCRDIILSKEQVERLLATESAGKAKGRITAWEWHRQEKRERYQINHSIGYGSVKTLSKHDLFLIGLALYWSEGSKKDRRVLLTNSDPYMITLYIRWLKECFDIKPNQITCRVTINEQHSDRINEIEKYWSNVVDIPLSQFTKTTRIKSKWVKQYENRNLYHGVLAVQVQKSTDLSYRVTGAIDRLRELGDFRGKMANMAG